MTKQKALYDDEWVKEMNRHTKSTLIEWFRDVCKARDHQIARKEQLVAATTDSLRRIERYFDKIGEAMSEGAGREGIVRMCAEASASVARARQGLSPEAPGNSAAKLDELKTDNERLRDMVKAMRTAAVKSLHLSHEGEQCRACGEMGGEHAHGCPVIPVIDISLMPIDWVHHGPEYLDGQQQDAGHALLVARSLAELTANAHKGDFATWVPSPEDLKAELYHHADKYLAACDAGDLDEVAEHLGDLFNYIRKGWELMETARREQTDEG
jgi:hypothetical protein